MKKYILLVAFLMTVFNVAYADKVTVAIGEIERYLITLGEAANPQLSKIQGRLRKNWGIRGVVRSGKGKLEAISQMR